MRIQRNRLLAPYTTMGVGGPCLFFIEVSSLEEMEGALAFARDKALPPFILGKGSNLLFDDAGFEGVVILNKIESFKQCGDRFHVGAGYPFTRLGIQTARLGYTGLEFASGVPGSVGGAVFMNAGAAGQEIAHVLEAVEGVHYEGGRERFTFHDLSFSYRTSPFQKMALAIVSATFRLKKLSSARRDQLAYLAKRSATQPLNEKSSGCIFRNPEGKSAGALIDCSGLKGAFEGGASVSKAHGNFIVNNGGATCQEILTLIERIKFSVREALGVDLREEVRYIQPSPNSPLEN